MLPFLKPRKYTSVMMASMKPDGAVEQEGPEDETNHALMAAAEDLISAVHAKDASAVAEAMQAAFEICDSMYHEEGDMDRGDL